MRVLLRAAQPVARKSEKEGLITKIKTLTKSPQWPYPTGVKPMIAIDESVVREWFPVGHYGEIMPPHLAQSPEVFLTYEERLFEASRQTSAPLDDVRLPQPGDSKSRRGYESVLAHYAHENVMREVLAGEHPAHVGKTGPVLRTFVQNGIPLSLRPVDFPQRHYRTFVPTLKRLTDNTGKLNGKWLVGDLHQGRHTIIEAESPASAYVDAKQLVTAWGAEEHVSLKKWLREQTKDMAENAYIIAWVAELAEKGRAVLKPLTALERWGPHHEQYAFCHETGIIPFTTSGDRLAAKCAYKMIKELPAPPSPNQVLKILVAELPSPPTSLGGLLTCHNITLRKSKKTGEVVLNHGDFEYRGQISDRGATLKKTGGRESQFDFPESEEWADANARYQVAAMWMFATLQRRQ
jgi:hypothetical protein